jgi:hypothetical protein
MDSQKQINKLKASVRQIAKLPYGRFNSFAEEARMEEILILLTEVERLENIEISDKKSVFL